MNRLLSSIAVFAMVAAGCQQSPRIDPPVSAVAANHPTTSSVQRTDVQDKGDSSGVYFSKRPLPSDDDGGTNPIYAALGFVGNGIGSLFSALDFPVQGVPFHRWITGHRPNQAARLATDGATPDQRRQGIYDLLEYNFTKRPPYTKMYRMMSTAADEDATVRAAAIRASNRSRDKSATPIFVSALSDSNEMVRLEATKALVHLPSEDADAPLMRILADRDGDKDVRIAAADALKHYRNLPTIRALAAALDDREFAICWQARRSLMYLTGKDFGYDAGAWLEYVSGPNSPL